MGLKIFTCGRLGASWIMFYLTFLAVVAFVRTKTDAQEIRSPANEFSRYRLVQPTVHHARTKREISSTKHEDGLHHLEVTITLDIDGEPHVLDLRLNTDLVAADHIISYQKDGKTILHKPTIEELDICQYSGKVRGKEGSWAALSTCHGVRGIIHDGKQMRYIEPAEGNEIYTKHYIYDHSDLSNELHYGNVGGVTNNTAYDPDLMKQYKAEKNRENSRNSRYKRALNETELRGPFKLSRYVELVLVADNREYRASGERLYYVHLKLKAMANIINAIYAPLNIFIVLVGVVVWSERDEIQLRGDANETLADFLLYRRNRLLHDIPNDNAYLLTRQEFKDAVIGLSPSDSICSEQSSGGVVINHSYVIGLVAANIAHEMGHNFGMEHDTETDCQCPDGICIMNQYSYFVDTRTHFSSRSLRYLALSLERGMDYCLRNKPTRLFEAPTCGEPGLDCDCGLVISAACAECCKMHSCLYSRFATCAAGECCDLQTCRLKPYSTVCRPADNECDLPEYCGSRSEFCSKDVFKMDSTPCSNDGMCLNKTCVSVAAFREQIPKQDTSVCPSNCSGHGVCNSEGHCHCEAGYNPPLCDGPGLGGSFDSGPATHTISREMIYYTPYIGPAKGAQ